MKNALILRPERPSDYQQIRELNFNAFGSYTEANLIERLRMHEEFIPELSIVAVEDSLVQGYILFTPVSIVDTGFIFQKCLTLAPVCVQPNKQKRGIGSALVREGLSSCGKSGFTSVIVLGHPEYYPRFGFKPASLFAIKSPFPVKDPAFMALELLPNSLQNIRGTVEYLEPFNDLE